ncbi:hypothetical protein ILUMI_15531 [Ignelater luminosus]|uniref:Uncharacterized protein n=1 Tax=Ignelater luminosus TaxID=2038154 RepID=A0A8K0CSQ5_IGNLU|nr:hypothetical protein ILUMI_15531 [Ignelater luminosus]
MMTMVKEMIFQLEISQRNDNENFLIPLEDDYDDAPDLANNNDYVPDLDNNYYIPESNDKTDFPILNISNVPASINIPINCCGSDAGNNVATSDNDAIDESIPSASNNAVQLRDYLLWPKTPERKGKKNSEKRSHVITSSGWKAIFEGKEREKREKEKKKEDNKKKRNEKTVANTKKQHRTKKGKEKAIGEPMKQSPTRQPLTHVRNLSSLSENPSTFESLVQSSAVQHNNGNIVLPPKNNIIRNKGLCFICVANISLLNFGIQCQKCTRLYHLKCLRKHSLYKEYFTCKVCINK